MQNDSQTIVSHAIEVLNYVIVEAVSLHPRRKDSHTSTLSVTNDTCEIQHIEFCL
jgi:hypothetical protein